MNELKFNINEIINIINKLFPNSKIKYYKRFSQGLVSQSFKVKINNPNKNLVIKLSRLKNKDRIHKNNLILDYLNKNKIPAPRLYFDGVVNRKFVTIMEYSSGEVATRIYKDSNDILRRKILFNVGKNLKKIHDLDIPLFWNHQEHEIKNIREWKKWTLLRIKKYLKFFSKKLENYNLFEKELINFWNILKNKDIDFVPLHWDYHLSNLNVDYKGQITGIFDFDNAMKGHSLADIAQTNYWILFEFNDNKNFNYFLRGYKKEFTKDELKMIKGYLILHILAVSRTIWFRQKRLGWIIKKHKKILEGILIK